MKGPPILVSLLVIATVSPLAAAALTVCGGTDERETRRVILSAALNRGAAQEAWLRQVATEKPESDLSRLAAILLNEWRLPPDHPWLALPRLISVPKLDDREIRAALPDVRFPLLVVASPLVDREGFVISCSILRASEYQLINEMAWEACMQARFRPARGDSGYVHSRRTNIHFNWHPQL